MLTPFFARKSRKTSAKSTSQIIAGVDKFVNPEKGLILGDFRSSCAVRSKSTRAEPPSSRQCFAGSSMRPRFYQQEEDLTGRTLMAIMIFAGIIVAVMWFLVLPAVAGIKPSIQ